MIEQRLAELIRSFADEDGDVIELRPSPSGAQYRHRLRECIGSDWYHWSPLTNAADLDFIRRALADLGWSWSVRYAARARIYFCIVEVSGIYKFHAHNRNYNQAVCEAVSLALAFFREELENGGQQSSAITERELRSAQSDNSACCCGVDDAGRGGRCGRNCSTS